MEISSRLLNLAKKFNCFYLTGFSSECRPFIVMGHHVGLIRPEVLKQILNYPEVFCFHETEYDKQGVVELNPAFRDYTERTEQLERVLLEWRKNDIFVTLRGWRNECYEVKAGSVSLMKMDRSATPLFGVVKHPETGELSMWLQQRSATKQTWPGYWDNMISGGLSVGYGIFETAMKEAAEEASVPSGLMQNLKSAGSVSFFFESERGLFPNTEFVFDLELPMDFEPKCADGEVQDFQLLTIRDCLERLFSPDFKTTSCPVVIDFLVRHGFITPENEVDYTQIIELLHVPLQSIYKHPKLVNSAQNGFSH